MAKKPNKIKADSSTGKEEESSSGTENEKQSLLPKLLRQRHPLPVLQLRLQSLFQCPTRRMSENLSRHCVPKKKVIMK
jgi:hypothetical protein